MNKCGLLVRVKNDLPIYMNNTRISKVNHNSYFIYYGSFCLYHLRWQTFICLSVNCLYFLLKKILVKTCRSFPECSYTWFSFLANQGNRAFTVNLLIHCKFCGLWFCFCLCFCYINFTELISLLCALNIVHVPFFALPSILMSYTLCILDLLIQYCWCSVYFSYCVARYTWLKKKHECSLKYLLS